ncbi:hypothetical protein WKW50_23885 [Ochrobactrum sp. GPK 3]|uniref:hypothetical protein n=1 Tax=Brucella sp. 22210 TaxID=3453892 RepID=UPI0031385293
MKNPNRTVVVEYKNRRARKGNTSLWGNLDLKSIAREVEADATLILPETPVTSDPAQPISGKAAAEVVKAAPQAEPVDAMHAEVSLEAQVPGVVPPEAEGMPINIAKPQAEMRAEDIVRVKKAPVRSPVKKSGQRKQKAESRSIAEPDIRVALSSLETENAALKREWAAKLHSENGSLLLMLERLEQRGK